LREQPGRLGRKRRWRLADLRIIGESHGRPDDYASLLFNQIHQVIVAKVGRSSEQVRIVLLGKSRVGICDDCGEKRPPVDEDKNGLIVGDKFGEQRKDEQCQKNPERPVATAIGLEIFPPTLVEG
jgi:hypothetical protein